MRFLIIFCILFAFELPAEEKKTICLNMIVKNESHVIKRCLDSVRPIIDTWVIVDTGSSDGTQEIIKEYLKDMPGELHERPWVNFGHNREEALELARGKADYILFMDADDMLAFSENFKMPPLTLDYYLIPTCFGNVILNVPRLVKADGGWHWEGVLHEYIRIAATKQGAPLEGVKYVCGSDGSRSKNPNKHLDDIKVLEEALAKEPENARYVFYLAQSYVSNGDLKNALKTYEKRTQMGGYEEEIFLSKLNIAQIQELQKVNAKTVEESYIEAYKYRSNRLEPLYYIVHNLREKGHYQKGFEIASLGLLIPPTDRIFVQTWIYEYGMLYEYAYCAFNIKKYKECFNACNQLLAMKNLPPKFRADIQKLQAHLQSVNIDSVQKAVTKLISKESNPVPVP